MNVIFILMDSLNRHYLEAYGCRQVKSPNISELAQRGVTFTNHIIGSAPCMPARRELMTGRREFLWRGWGSMEPFDRHIAARCRQAGFTTQIITDHYHYWEHGGNGYMQGFNAYEMIRGHEHDARSTTVPPEEPDWVKAVRRYRSEMGLGFWRNAAHYKTEEDWPSVQTFTRAAQWLDENAGVENFLLWIESFDPHEPHYVPEPYRSMYTDSDGKDYTCWPPYQRQEDRVRFFRETSMDELAWIRAQYQGKLTMADRALGKVWRMMDKHRLWDNTMVILTTDHGHELAEAVNDPSEATEDGRDSTLRIPYAKGHPHYLSHANIPFIVWHPELANDGRREDAMTTAVDLYATLLEACGCEDVSSPHGRSIMPILKKNGRGRDFHYWGSFSQGICCTDGEWVLLQGADGSKPLYSYSAVYGRPDAESGKFMPGVDWPLWRMEQKVKLDMPSILYRKDDPLFREKNVIAECPDVADRLRRKLREAVSEDGCPPEQFERLGI